MTTKAEEKTALQVIVDPETGELMEVNLDAAAQPESADIRQAFKLHEIDGPVAILGVKIQPGVTFDKEYAEFLFLREPGKIEMGVTASAEMVATFRRLNARGMATPAAPVLCKFKTDTKTSSGYFVHKMEKLTELEEAALRGALRGA